MTEAERLVQDIVNMTGEDVQERRLAVAQTWIDSLRGFPEMKAESDYKRERRNERVLMIAAVVASGAIPKVEPGQAAGIKAATTAIDVALELVARVERLP